LGGTEALSSEAVVELTKAARRARTMRWWSFMAEVLVGVHVCGL